MAEQIQGYERAVELVNKRQSPRARRLAELERWVEGRQYEGKRPWDEDCPIAEKAPCIVEPIVCDAIESHVDMVLGEGRFPAISTRPAEDEDEDTKGEPDADFDDDEGGLNEEDSAAVDRLIQSLSEQARFPALCREALGAALGCGSSAAIYGIRGARLFGDTVKARWCEPTLAPNGRDVLKLVIQYPYIDQYQDTDGTWKARARIYRREIDDTKDVTMAPADAESDAQPKWTPAEGGTFVHGFGFCPVIWYPHMRGATIVGQIDGNAIHQHITDEIYAHDVAVSQRHRAALYAGDPQWTEAGVDADYNPSAPGKVVPLMVTANGGPATADNPVIGEYRGESSQQTGRKKHPGTIWQYDNSDVKVTLHSLPGDALKALDDHAHDVRSKLLQALAYVPLDTENSAIVRGLTGKAIELLKQRQSNRDDKIRDDFGDRFIKPSISMLLRIANSKGDGLRLRGMKRAKPVLARFAGADEASSAVA